MSRITIGEKPIGVDDDLPDVVLVQVEMVPKWSERMVHFLTTVSFEDVSSDIEEQAKFMEACQCFQLVAERLYYLGDDNVMRLVICLDDYEPYLQEAHVSPTGIHFSKDNTLRRILWDGIWCLTLTRDVAKYVHDCAKFCKTKTLPYVTPYHTQMLSRWSEHLV